MINNVTLVKLSSRGASRSLHPQDFLPPFSIGYVATILQKKGLNISVIDTSVDKINNEGITQFVDRYNTDLVIIDCFSTAEDMLNDLAKKLSSLDKVKIWCMGHFASTLPETLLTNNKFIDYCIIGEPEETAAELIDCANNKNDIKKIKGIALRKADGIEILQTDKRPLIKELDKLPPINFKLLKIEKYKIFSAHIKSFNKLKWGFLLTSRGCPYKCIYCSTTLRQSYGEQFRANSPGHVVMMMQELIKEHGINTIAFQDDIFTFNRNRTIKICNKIIERGLKIKWIIQTRADCLDEELLYLLKKAGCECIALGIESGSDRILSVLRKDITKDKIRQTIKLIRSFNISLIAFFMIGNPTEEYSELKETFEFARELSPIIIQVAFFCPYPGSLFFDSLEKKRHKIENLYHYHYPKVNPSRVSDKKLATFQKSFYLRYYLSPEYILNYLRHRVCYSMINNHEYILLYKVLKYFFVN